MAKLTLMTGKNHAVGALRFWKSVRTLATGEIAEETQRPFMLTLTGTTNACASVMERLGHEGPTLTEHDHGPADIRAYVQCSDSAGSLTLNADILAHNEAALAPALAQIVMAHPDLRLALACHVPAFRPAVTAQLIAEASWDNAKIAVVSALPGIIPFTDIFLPATALGDMILLTRNQATLLLRIAAAYGLPPDIRERTRELLPVVGSAFGWRAVARELIGLVPGGIGVVVKGSVAYAGTYTVGKAASIYYSTGQTLSGPRLRQLYCDALRDATGRVRGLMRRPKQMSDTGNNLTLAVASKIDKPSENGV